jgi:hypothetical protein
MSVNHEGEGDKLFHAPVVVTLVQDVCRPKGEGLTTSSSPDRRISRFS